MQLNKESIMKKIGLLIFLSFSVLTLYAQEKGENKSNIKISFSERLRIEAYDNVTDLSNLGTGNQAYTRAKSTLGFEWSINSDILFSAKLTNEFRKYFIPKKNPFHWNEVFFEGLSFKFSNFGPGTLTIGRQDIVMGDGFVIKEGTPGDATRDYYFNALRYDLKLDKVNTITFLLLYQPKEDNLLPVFNGMDLEASSQGDNSFIVNDQSEKSAGVYYTGDFGKFNLQSYYLWKNIKYDGKKYVPESDIHTIGSRIKNTFSEQVSLTAEAAYQFGTYGNFNRTAYAGNVFIDYKTLLAPVFLPRILTFGFILMSGDDTSTSDYEGWDPLFSRWPRWSNSYVTLLGKEYGRNAYWTNLSNIYFKMEFNVGKDVDLIIQNQYMMAPQKSLKTSLLSGDGTNRGNLTTILLNYKFNGNMSGHILFEHLEPGSYYFTGHDNYNYFRTELIFTL
jgi:hypothetical protein